MIWMMLLGACKQADEPLEVLDELDNPTANLTAELIPQVVDDYMRNAETYRLEQFAFTLLDIAAGGRARTSQGLLADDSLPQQEFIGGAICAVGFIAELASYESCQPGQSCTAELTFNSCLMSDEYARGKLHMRVSHEQVDGLDRGELAIEFDDFRSDDGRPGLATEVDGILSVEGAISEDLEREELIYTADLRTRLIDMRRRVPVFGGGVIEDIHVRAGMRVIVDNTPGSELASVEMLAYVDEDGDGIPTASVVLRMTVEELENGDLEDLTLEIIGAGGGWTCGWENVERISEDGVSWISSGFCTDPDGNEVDFSGTVGD